ncbi:unnamed protein product [Medioppia subpectinata]|uniref:glucose-6-phosphatase n=1 Tax=Medioppia subpectinata TaxID=1979941 RepID=A0A7R9Q925_9ACAR|nr:unnamed protein product [Medioppia subpectinata]CAG2116844.1 unnamed protein product [Medioppia subpectinata]
MLDTIVDKFRLYEVLAMSSFQSHLSLLEPIFIFASNLGDPQNGYVLYFVFGFIFVSHSAAFKMLWTAVLSEWLNLILKWTFNDERPYWWAPMAAQHLAATNHSHYFQDVTTDYEYARQLNRLRLKQFPITCETGPGFPSGHVMCSAAVWFSLIIQLIKHKVIASRRQRLFTRIAFISTLMLVSLGRIYISAHFPDQCLIGLFAGIVLAVMVEKLVDIQRLALGGHILISMLLMAIAYAFHECLNRFGGQSGADWSLELAKLYCADINNVKADTSPLYVVWRASGAAVGIGVAFTQVLPLVNKNNYLSVARNKNNFTVRLINTIVSTVAVVIYVNYSRPEPTFGDQIGRFYGKSFVQFLFIPIVGLVSVLLNDKIMRFYFNRVHINSNN